MVSIRAMELETAKEILAEVFHARPGEVEEMIKSRLEEGADRRSAKRGGGRRRSAWVISYGTKFREREDGREGRLCQMAEGQPGA